MQLMLIRVDPVQEIAAEPATLDALKTALSPHTQPPQAAPGLIGTLTSWPLIADPSIPAGYVHCRPHRHATSEPTP